MGDDDEQLVPGVQYCLVADTDLYDSPSCSGLATQAFAGRYFALSAQHTAPVPSGSPAEINLLEDGYLCWLAPKDRAAAKRPAVCGSAPFHAQLVPEEEVRARAPRAVEFVEAATTVPNSYFWGGTLGPNYDCSGLVQAAFKSVGVWVPRDAYQQETFVSPLDEADVRPGDLLFFGPADGGKIDHVGMCVAAAGASGVMEYIHSSGAKYGNDGAQRNKLNREGAVAAHYSGRVRGFGRVVGCVDFNPCPTE